MSLELLAAAAILGALIFYAVLGGADFGGGVWDGLARGPRAARQRAVIEHAIAPVWEANHVWLIVAVVLLFSCFPPAFAAVATALHVPITLVLVGIVLRGSAFTFRHYDTARDTAQSRWGRPFAVASAATPVLMGVCVGAVTQGIRFENGVPVGGFFLPWLGVFPFVTGAFALALFAFLAAAYLCWEAPDPDLREDFRRRALFSEAAVVVLAVATAAVAGPAVRDRLLHQWWSAPLLAATVGATTATVVLLLRRSFRAIRQVAAAQVALVLGGWGLLQAPWIVYPGITIHGAAAPAATLRGALVVLGAGAVVLVPSLYLLLRVFKREPAFEALQDDEAPTPEPPAPPR